MKITVLTTLSIIFFIACSSREDDSTTDASEQNVDTLTNTLTLTPVGHSPEFLDAELEMLSPESEERYNGTGEVPFSYSVNNYTLGNQTEDASDKHCANSAKGQHIHVILNNEPYTAHYEANFTKEIPEGYYVALSFLSRSYHESIKTKKAYDLRQFTVGDTEAEHVDINAPMIFYSRPKGEYTGEDTKKVLLDFYLTNVDLSEEGYKVKATVNGTEFLLDKWVPYFMEGLPAGENTIRLELINSEGELVDGPFNPVERTVTLTP